MVKDPYVLKDGTLKNLLGITDYSELKKAEADIGFVKIITVDSIEADRTDVELIKKIHKHIFEDIFEWAGNFRTVPLYKTEQYVIPGLSLEYAKPEDIEEKLIHDVHDLNSIRWNEKSLNDKSMEFAKILAKIWKVHPFRDGNTRTVLSFASIYAKEHGFPMDMSVFLERLSRGKNEMGRTMYSARDLFVFAALDDKDYPEPEHLANLIKKAIVSEKEKNNVVEKE